MEFLTRPSPFEAIIWNEQLASLKDRRTDYLFVDVAKLSVNYRVITKTQSAVCRSLINKENIQADQSKDTIKI